jgi:hypothetical protein
MITNPVLRASRCRVQYRTNLRNEPGFELKFPSKARRQTGWLSRAKISATAPNASASNSARSNPPGKTLLRNIRIKDTQGLVPREWFTKEAND